MPDTKQVENILINLTKPATEDSDASTTNSDHNTLGGGTCMFSLVYIFVMFSYNCVVLLLIDFVVKCCPAAADMLLWRNKKVSASVLSSAAAVWILFEWINYNFPTRVSFFLIIGMLG